jgi:hypothetical protein
LPVEAEPLVGSLPLQPPEAVQEVAFVEDQVKVELVPLTTVLGLAASVTAGFGWVTETVADCDALPPAPVQVSVNVVFAFNAPVDCEPLTARFPLQPPLAVHEVALVADHVSVALLPAVIDEGLAVKVTVGAAADAVTVAVCDALPPGPVQVSVKDWSLVRLPVEAEPLVGSLPLQPPEATQEVAFVEVQVSVELAPFATVLGFADRLTVGSGWVTDTVADWEALPPVPVQVRV